MARVTTSLSERLGAGPGRSKVCWIIGDPFIVSSTMVKMVVRTVALSSICSALLVCLYSLQTEAYYSSHSLSPTRTKRIYMLFIVRSATFMRRLFLFDYTFIIATRHSSFLAANLAGRGNILLSRVAKK